MENSAYNLEHLKGISETLRLNIPESPTESYLSAIDNYRSEVPDILDELTTDKLESDKDGFLENVDRLESLLHGIKELMLVVHCDNLRQAANADDLDIVTKCLAKIKPGAQDLVEHVSQVDKNSKHYVHSGNELLERVQSGRTTIEERQREFLSKMPKLSDLTENSSKSVADIAKEVQGSVPEDGANQPTEDAKVNQPEQAAAKSKYSTEDFAKTDNDLVGGEADFAVNPASAKTEGKSPDNTAVQNPEILQTTEREQAIIKDKHSSDASDTGKSTEEAGEPQMQADSETKDSAKIPEHHEVTEENIHTYNEHQLFSTLNGLIVKEDLDRSAAFCKLLLTHKFGDDVINMLKSIIDTLDKSDFSGAQTQSRLLLVALENNQLEDKPDTEIQL